MRVMGKIEIQWLTNRHGFYTINNTKLTICYDDRVKLRVTNGELIPNEERCKGVRIKIQETIFTIEVHVLLLVGCNMVIGI